MQLDEPLNILIIGLGGGVLAMYCKTWLKNVKIDAVDWDDKVAIMAKNWFGLKEDENLKVHIEDGLKFVSDAAKQGIQINFSIFSSYLLINLKN